MTRSALPDWLTPHRGMSPDTPRRIENTDATGVSISGEFAAVEGVGCSINGLHVAPAQPLPENLDGLRSRAQHLVDALPHGLAIQEVDAAAPSILLRSPARREDMTVEYEEAVLGPDGVQVRRFENSPETGRHPVELPLTWEQFDTLVEAARTAVAPPADEV